MKMSNLAVMTFMMVSLAGFSRSLHAAPDDGAIVKVTAVTSPRLGIYSRPALDSKVKELARDAVKMPLQVLDTAEDETFLRVNIDGDNVWVRAVQVGTARAVSAGCLAQATAPQSTAAIRGANRGCSK